MRKVKFKKGKIYHVFNRGVEKRSIFNNDSDKWRFLQGLYLFNDNDISLGALYNIERENEGRINFILLKEFIRKYPIEKEPLVRIMADCLMPNHYHLLIEELRENGISRFMHKLGAGYANFFNKKYSRVGPLFQGRFKAAEIKNDLQLQYILAYINVINPGQLIESNLKEKGVESVEGVMNFARKYSWSTNPDYIGIRDSVIIDKGILKDFFPTPEKYENFVRSILLSKRYKRAKDLFLE